MATGAGGSGSGDDGAQRRSTFDPRSSRITLGSGRVNPEDFDLTVDVPPEYQANPQAWLRMIRNSQRVEPAAVRASRTQGLRRCTREPSEADFKRWESEDGLKLKLGIFADNHMAMMKALDFELYDKVPQLANVKLHVTQATVLANQYVLTKGSRWFLQYFRYQATEPKASHVSCLIFVLLSF
jgi:hypothetical protein